jgi:glycerol-3-phosphate dehydrogenase subunit B
MQVTSAESDDSLLSIVYSEAAARLKPHRAESFVLATGGFLGGGLVGEPDGNLREIVFGLPVQGTSSRSQWFSPQFLEANGHPIFRAGIRINGRHNRSITTEK